MRAPAAPLSVASWLKLFAVQVVVAAEPPVTIPDVDGQDQVAAQQALQAAGFQVQVVPTPHDTVPSGKVISTNPAGGTKALKGTTVSMAVSTGPTSVPVPNTVGQQCQAGASQLASSGFNVTINGNAAGTVTAQNPGGRVGSFSHAASFNVTVTGNTSGMVTAQNPGGGTAPPGSGVAITCV